MACVIAERLRMDGVAVTLVTTEDRVAAWGEYTAERVRSQKRLMELDVDIFTAHGLEAFDGRQALIKCTYTGRKRRLDADAVVMVTARQPNDALFHALRKPMEDGAVGSPRSLTRIGDCEAPAIIAAAIFSSLRYARELDACVDADKPIRRGRWFEFESAQA